MTRFVSSTNETEAAKVSVTLCLLAEFDLLTGFVRVHDGTGNLSFGGNTYYGIGQFGSVETIEESTDTVARGVRCTLTGVDATLLSDVIAGGNQGRDVTFYLGLLAENSMTFVADPEEVWGGRLDTFDIKLSKGAASIKVSAEHRLRREPTAARYTNEDQQIRFANDRGFDMLHLISTTKAAWGEKPAGYRGTTNGRTITPSSRNLLR